VIAVRGYAVRPSDKPLQLTALRAAAERSSVGQRGGRARGGRHPVTGPAARGSRRRRPSTVGASRLGRA